MSETIDIPAPEVRSEILAIRKKMDRLQQRLSRLEKTIDLPDPKPNAAVLPVAADWLRPLVRDIGELERPTHETVLRRIQQEFPSFYGVPYDDPERSFIKGDHNLNKAAISEALAYLFGKRHEQDITPGAIRKRFARQNLW